MRRALILSLALVLPAPALAQDAPKDPPATIALSATGNASAEPDMADLSFSVEERAETAKAALDAASAAVDRALKALSELGVEPRDIQTQNFAVQPVVVYPNRRKSNATPEELAPKVVGYRVTNGLAVELRDLDRLGALLDRMVSAGMNSIGSIRFTNEDVDAVREKARRDAVMRAASRARTLAEAAGVKLGRVLSIREGAVQTPRPIAFEARMDKAASSVPVARGESDYTVTVRMEWAIEQ